ncbi:MAG: lytic transglycosylase domain-containing protein [Lachnospiraceae bacterium]|nr:lytic transglycosylase domain-containing protein [Lachnospiraceae bacterium]
MSVNNVNNVVNAVQSNNKTNETQPAKKTGGDTFASYYNKELNAGSLEEYFQEAADKYGVDVNFLKAIAKQESDFQPNCTSRAGAMGIMQLMPETAKSLGVTDAYDPKQNIMGGAKFISELLKKYNGDKELALAAYNAGPNNVKKYGGIPPFAETQDYVKKVMGYYNNGVSIPSNINNYKVGNGTNERVRNSEKTETVENAAAEASTRLNSELLSQLSASGNDGEDLLVQLRELLSKINTKDDSDSYSFEEYARFMKLYLDGIAISTISGDKDSANETLAKELDNVMEDIKANLGGSTEEDSEDALTALGLSAEALGISEDDYYSMQQISYNPAVLNLLNGKKN